MVNNETICKIIYGATNGDLTDGRRIVVLSDARRFILAWGIKHRRKDDVSSFVSNDSVLCFGLGTDQCAAPIKREAVILIPFYLKWCCLSILPH